MAVETAEDLEDLFVLARNLYYSDPPLVMSLRVLQNARMIWSIVILDIRRSGDRCVIGTAVTRGIRHARQTLRRAVNAERDPSTANPTAERCRTL